MTPIKVRYGLTHLAPVKEGDLWFIEGKINPEDKKPTDAKVPDPSKPNGGEKKDGEEDDKIVRLEQGSQAVQQGVARSRNLLRDGGVQAKLKEDGRLKGEVEEEQRQLEAELPSLKDDVGVAVELRTTPWSARC